MERLRGSQKQGCRDRKTATSGREWGRPPARLAMKTVAGLLFASTLCVFTDRVALAASAFPPAGAWIVEKTNGPTDDDSMGAPGIALLLSATELTVVKDGQVRRDYACQSSPLSEGNWTLTCNHELLILLPKAKGRLQLRTGGVATTLRPATSPENERLQNVVADSRSAAPIICGRAERCCREALPLLGGKCGVDELPLQRIPNECSKVLTAYLDLLKQAGKATPPSCASGR